MAVNSLFGIETEYGITVEGAGASDLVAASREVVASYAGKSARGWNYRAEDPRADQRGFRVERLSQDPTDAQFDKPTTRPMTPSEERADRVLQNGARLYNDHGHPEYSTPECSDLRSLVAHDKAGERIVLECARAYAKRTGRETEIFKNNTDFHGASYGTHESYLLRREVDWENVVRTLAPFLATRIIYAGAGKVGTEGANGSPLGYQLSQRADFFSVLQSVDTLHNRPLVNTRDEAHGDARRFRRLHVIAGDANMSEYATALRVGTLNLVVALIERDWACPILLRDPVRAIKQVSRDITYRWQIESDGGLISAVDVQRAYLRAAQELQLPGSEWVLGEWEDVLNALASDPLSLSDRVDWVAKKLLLDEFSEAEGLDPARDALTLQSLDLAYHNVDPDAGLYYGLVESGAMTTLVSDEEIEAARCHAPANTRAALRGFLVRRFGEAARATSWGGMSFEDSGGAFNVTLREDGDYPALLSRLETAETLRDVAVILNGS